MDIGSILLGLALLFIVSFIVARPLLEGSRFRERQPGPADELLAERERVLVQLRDLDFDHATGKILDADHAAQRAVLVARGVELLKQLDALAASTAPAAPAAGRANGHASAVDAEIEAAVARARRPAAAPVDDEIEGLVAQRRARPAPAAAAPAVPAQATACAECGAAVAPDDRFCPKCGAAQTFACPACGRPARAADQFCGGCGQRLPSRANGLSQAQAPN
jgi:hypothetical protein